MLQMYFSYKGLFKKTAVSSILWYFSFMVEQEMLNLMQTSKIDANIFHC